MRIGGALTDQIYDILLVETELVAGGDAEKHVHGPALTVGFAHFRKKPGYVFLKEVRRIRPDFAQKYDPIWKDAGEELMAFVDPMQCRTSIQRGGKNRNRLLQLIGVGNM